MLGVHGHPYWFVPPLWFYVLGSAMLPTILMLGLLAVLLGRCRWLRAAGWLAVAGELGCCELAVIERGPQVLLPCEGDPLPPAYVLVSLFSRVLVLGLVVAAVTVPLWRKRFRVWLGRASLQRGFPVVMR